MPQVYSSGFGQLNLQPNVIQRPVDPLERAIKQAQLYNLQTEPNDRRRQSNLEQLRLDQTRSNDTATQQHLADALAELKSHQATEETGRLRPGFDVGHQLLGGIDQATGQPALTETARANRANEAINADRTKTSTIDTLIPTLANSIDPNVRAALPSVLDKLGRPELKQALDAGIAKQLNDTSGTVLSTVLNLHKIGDLKSYQAALNDYKTKSPEGFKLIEPHLPAPLGDNSKEAPVTTGQTAASILKVLAYAGKQGPFGLIHDAISGLPDYFKRKIKETEQGQHPQFVDFVKTLRQ